MNVPGLFACPALRSTSSVLPFTKYRRPSQSKRSPLPVSGMHCLNSSWLGVEHECGSKGSLGGVTRTYSTPIGSHTITPAPAPPTRGHSREETDIDLQTNRRNGPHLTKRRNIWLRFPSVNVRWTPNGNHKQTKRWGFRLNDIRTART